MQRFLPVGSARLQVLGAVMHDAQESRRVADSLAGMDPEVLFVDRSVDEWTGRPDGFQSIVLETVPGLHPNVLWRDVDAAARRLGKQVALLHRHVPPPPPAGLKQLRRLLAQEGFDAAGDPRQDLQNLHQHYVSRCRDLQAWSEARRDASAARLRAALETRPSRGVAVIAVPDMHAVCDRVQQWGAAPGRGPG